MGMDLLGAILSMVGVGVVLFLFARFCANDENDNRRPKSPEEKTTNQVPESKRISSGIPYSNEYCQRISTADSLTNATMQVISSTKQMKKAKYLFGSDVAAMDTIFFSCFILRMICVMSTRNRAAAEQFSDLYVSDVLRITRDTFVQENYVSEMFDNRTGFYDKILSSKSELADGIPALLQNFEFIIQTDLIEKKYVPFSSYSPIPVMDIFDAMECRAEIYSFFEILIEDTKEKVKQAIDSIL